MNENYQNIMLVTDGTENSKQAEESALNLASQRQSRVTIVDTLRPQPAIAKWLTDKYEDHFDEFVADKQKRLDTVAKRFVGAGVSSETRLLFGKSAHEITRAAISEKSDLVIRYLKGAESKRRLSRYGTTAMNLMRVCPCPLLLVGDQPVSTPKVLACVDAEHSVAENRVILNAAKRLAADKHHLMAIYCWHLDESRFQHHFESDKLHPDKPAGQTALNLYREETRKHYEKIYDRFIQQHDLSDFPGGLHLENGQPHVVIPELCRQEGVDVVVMSSASQNHPLHLLLGSTIESVIEHMPCSLLVTKPSGFKSPVNVDGQFAKSKMPDGHEIERNVNRPKAHVTVFDDLETTKRVVEELHESGVALSQIELITNDNDLQRQFNDKQQAHESTESSLIESATKWGSVGAVAGSLSIVLAPFPGLVLGAIAIGGITGAIIGGMSGIELAVEDDSVELPTLGEYERHLHQGHCILVVRGTHAEVSQVESIVKQTENVQSHILTLHGHEFHEHLARGETQRK